jgi:hypothetical protein
VGKKYCSSQPGGGRRGSCCSSSFFTLPLRLLALPRHCLPAIYFLACCRPRWQNSAPRRELVAPVQNPADRPRKLKPAPGIQPGLGRHVRACTASSAALPAGVVDDTPHMPLVFRKVRSPRSSCQINPPRSSMLPGHTSIARMVLR